MPTTPKKVRKLLKENKAKIISYEPFIITGNSSPAYRRRETSCHKFVKLFN